MAIAHEPIHPGEILLEEFLNPMGITQYRLAQTISVPARRINEIVHGKRAISPDTALRLSRALGTSDRFWINLQSRYDLDIAVSKHHEEFDQIKPLLSACPLSFSNSLPCYSAAPLHPNPLHSAVVCEGLGCARSAGAAE
jgi:antitoxin HigA-1